MASRAARGLAASIAKEASRESGAFYTLRSFAPASANAPSETFGGVQLEGAWRPLFFVSDPGVMRNASVLVRGDGPSDRFETPKGPLLPPKLGALVAASARRLDTRVTLLDVACALHERLHPKGVKLELLGRWEGVLGARFDGPKMGPLAFVWQRPDALTLALGSRGPTGRLVVPGVERAIADLTELAAIVPSAAAAITALL